MKLALPARLSALLCALSFCCVAAGADIKVQLVSSPSLSPDGSHLLFSRYGDIWRVPTKGGRAVRLTTHFASDSQPKYSPDGSKIAFVSDRNGGRQVFVMSARGGEPRQLTFHSEGFQLHDWYPNGESLLVSGSRDHHWRGSTRFMKISAKKRSAEHVLFNGYGDEGRVSPDGKQIVFVREGERWWRKGYYGARSAQVWIFNSETSEFRQLVNTPAGDRSPAWSADGKHVYFCSSDGAKNGARNLWQCELETEECVQLTAFEDDLVATPTVSKDGSTIVFSHLFDLYRYSPGSKEAPQKINIRMRRDDLPSDLHRRTLSSASDVTFSSDALEMAFVAGGDIWVMENELKEPVQITSTSEFESDPLFIDDGNALLFVGWKDGQADIWKAERADDSKYWWQSSEFKMTQITNDAEIESNLTLSPNKHELIYGRGRGDLWARDLKSGKDWMLVDAFSAVDYDISPDGRWVVYSQTDDNFNNDIWIAPVDMSSPAVNVSRHPDDEYGPRWSSDGKMIAFTGRRNDDEIDIYYMYLTEEDDDNGSRDRRLKKTLDAFGKARKSAAKKAAPKAAEAAGNKSDAAVAKADAKVKADDKPKTEDKPKVEEKATVAKAGPKLPEVKIDFKDIHRRLRRLSIANSSERILGWSPDGKKLIFTATVRSDSGTYYVTFPSELSPRKITSSSGSIKGWLKSPDRMLWLVNGVPGYQPLSGSGKTYSFSAYQQLSQSDRYRAGFETAWRVMRDAWYDKNYGNHNWDEIRRKYVKAATQAGDRGGLSLVMSLMLGELNGSHLGFYSRGDLGPSMEGGDDWRPSTAHLGVRFEDGFQGPGLKIKDVIPNSPAMDDDSRLEAGEIILSIDGSPVDPAMDLTTVLNGRSSRDIHLVVKSTEDKERHVVIRPTSYGAVRSALYQKWQDDNRAMVAKQADNIGYLHIQGMNWPSFLEFERELYDVGYGKDGLIIDVRDNGGGSTTDHLLTALTQPDHAVTVPRGGGPGYPQSRKVYATWNKPIVVMCNQNSYSNAEIFSHAIKNLGRGKLVGVPTAGGVISTGSARVMDVGTVRLPFRGWYLKSDGEDMELNGAVPDVIIWPQPTEIPNGVDHQLEKAVEVLQSEIEQWKAVEQPQLRNATDRLN